MATTDATAVNVTIPKDWLHKGQKEVRNDPARFKVLAAGRRWRKTSLGVILCIETAVNGGIAWWVAPSYKVAAVGWNRLKKLGHQIPGAKVREVDKIVVFPGGGWAQVRSADDPQSLRGEGLDLVVLDEYAFIKEVAWTEAIRPSLSDKLGKALFISTPKGHNSFFKLYSYAKAGSDPEWKAWTFPSSSNPFMDPAEIQNARKTLPLKIFEQEFLAEFVDDIGGVFRGIMAAAVAPEQIAPLTGHKYVFGVDWGRSNDFTVITVVDQTLGHCCSIDRFNQIDYSLQVKRLKALVERFDPIIVRAEANAMGEPVIEQLEEEGINVEPFQTTNATKKAAIESLALAFERGELKIVPDETLITELQAYEVMRLPSGLFRYSAPDGMHDDCVMSLAIAWQGSSKERWLVA